MPESIQNQRIEMDGWTIQLRIPSPNAEKHSVFLLLHGWTGDESVMWVFADKLPQEYIMVAPRGIYPTPLGGYGWQSEIKEGWPTIQELQPAARKLIGLVDLLGEQSLIPQADFERINIMGFSQGAATAYTIGLMYPERVLSIVGLSGFLPNDVADQVSGRPIEGKPIFIAHGTKDTLVPVTRARQSVELLERAGAKVLYCEDEVGHKLGTACFRAMQSFAERQYFGNRY